MRRSTIRRSIASIALVGATFGASAGVAGPGPNGHNDYGLCTAYFNGSPNKHKAPPFQALEEASGVEEGDSAEEVEAKVQEFCSTATPGGNGGTPGNPGYGQPKGKSGK